MEKQISVEEIQEIQKKAEQQNQRVERLRGSREQLFKQLKTDFDCETVDAANQKLQALENDGKAIAARIDKLKQRVVEEWEKFNANAEENTGD